MQTILLETVGDGFSGEIVSSFEKESRYGRVTYLIVKTGAEVKIFCPPKRFAEAMKALIGKKVQVIRIEDSYNPTLGVYVIELRVTLK